MEVILQTVSANLRSGPCNVEIAHMGYVAANRIPGQIAGEIIRQPSDQRLTALHSLMATILAGPFVAHPLSLSNH